METWAIFRGEYREKSRDTISITILGNRTIVSRYVLLTLVEQQEYKNTRIQVYWPITGPQGANTAQHVRLIIQYKNDKDISRWYRVIFVQRRVRRKRWPGGPRHPKFRKGHPKSKAKSPPGHLNFTRTRYYQIMTDRFHICTFRVLFILSRGSICFLSSDWFISNARLTSPPMENALTECFRRPFRHLIILVPF